MHRNINKATLGNQMKSGSNAVGQRKSCGGCGKTIRLRDGLNTVLCTAILEVVDASYETECEHYEERSDNSELSFPVLS
jgi:hypothetical protein